MSAAKTTTVGPLAGYEMTYIARNEIAEDALRALREKLAGIVTLHKGEVVMTEDWGKKKLAYPIGKESRGHYNYIVFTGDNAVVAEIERNLRIHEHVLRFLTVNLAQEFDAEAFKKKRAEFKAKKEREREMNDERHSRRRDYHDDHHHSSGRGEGEAASA